MINKQLEFDIFDSKEDDQSDSTDNVVVEFESLGEDFDIILSDNLNVLYGVENN
jgi:hypothetical protein